jgi:hypothetical protein
LPVESGTFYMESTGNPVIYTHPFSGGYP